MLEKSSKCCHYGPSSRKNLGSAYKTFCFDQQGQVTIFLTLIFFLMMGIGFLVFGGMREYLKSALVEDTFNLAGEDVLANYDRPLYDRYHVFFLDPREETYLAQDGKDTLTSTLEKAGFFQEIESEIQLNDTTKALDDDGKAMLKQIKEWETCLHIQKIPDILNQLLKKTEKKDTALDSVSDIDENASGKSSDSEAGKNEDGEEEMKQETEEEKKVKKSWKEWKELLQSVLDSGILLYVVEDNSSISDLELPSLSELPSKSSWKNRLSFNSSDISLTGFSNLQKLCEQGITVNQNSSLLGADVYLLPYIFESFTHYRNKDTAAKHRLSYEVEYLLGGKSSDKANLKYVANQLFLLRFLVNYGYALTDNVIKSEADTMALVLTGIVGFPEASDAVSALLIASLCYGESLLEVRALFSGEKVAITKSSENWNLSFTNAVYKLKSHSGIIKVKNGVNYQQYLAGLLIIQSTSKKLLYRMMDLMQSNITLTEPKFLIKNCISSFDWTGSFSWTPFYRRLIAFGFEQNSSYIMTLKRTVCYE